MRARRLPALSLACENDHAMAARTAKVLGPYYEKARGKWRLVVKETDRRKSLWYGSEAEASKMRDGLIRALDDRSGMAIEEAVERFLAVKARQGVTPATQGDVRKKLGWLLPADVTVGSISAPRAQSLYEGLAESLAVASHQKSLRRVKEFFAWCLSEKLISFNPFAEVKPIGKPNAGKPQLRQDEAKKLSDVLIDHASKEDPGALALLIQVLLGLRSSEVLNLRKRDLDRNGSVFVVDGTKNKNARRTLSIDSPIVRRLLARHVAGLGPDAFVFAPVSRTKPHATDYLYKRLRVFCRIAEVPIVCPHSLRGLHSSLAVQVGATSAHVAMALGHSSEEITRKHYLAPGALEASRTARLSDALIGDGRLEALIADLRTLNEAQLNHVAHELGFRR